MENAEFQRGDISIQWLEQHLPELTAATPPADMTRVAAIAAALLAERERGAPRLGTASATSSNSAAPTANAWRIAAWREGLRNS
jgi:acetyl-CoA carboxylase biotin carboxylase subunit